MNDETSKTSLNEQICAAFRELFGREATVVVRAPGRVNFLGAHVDFHEGWVLPATIDQAVWLAAAPTNDNLVTVHALNFQENGRFQLPMLNLHASSVSGDWINYPVGVAWALQEAGHQPIGMDVVVASDLPIGAGLSSSAALEMAFVLAWEALSDFELNGLARAKIGQHVETAYLDVGSGIMDQFASLHGRANEMILLDCRTLSHQMIPVPQTISGHKTAVLIAHSGIQRKLAAGAYKKRVESSHEATATLKKQLPHIQTLRDVSLDELEMVSHRLPKRQRRQALHVVGECARVQAGAAALLAGNLTAFGRLVRQSHISSRDNYGSSIPELDTLAAAAWSVDGCFGARFGGGGDGGVVQVLADETAVIPIQQAMNNAFEAEFGRTPPMFATMIADGARVNFVTDL